jgi:hypothetical protein
MRLSTHGWVKLNSRSPWGLCLKHRYALYKNKTWPCSVDFIIKKHHNKFKAILENALGSKTEPNGYLMKNQKFKYPETIPLKVLSSELTEGSRLGSFDPCWWTGGPPIYFYFWILKGHHHKRSIKTILHGLKINEMALSDQSDFQAFSRLHKTTYWNFINSGIWHPMSPFLRKMALCRQV